MPVHVAHCLNVECEVSFASTELSWMGEFSQGGALALNVDAIHNIDIILEHRLQLKRMKLMPSSLQASGLRSNTSGNASLKLARTSQRDVRK